MLVILFCVGFISGNQLLEFHVSFVSFHRTYSESRPGERERESVCAQSSGQLLYHDVLTFKKRYCNWLCMFISNNDSNTGFVTHLA